MELLLVSVRVIGSTIFVGSVVKFSVFRYKSKFRELVLLFESLRSVDFLFLINGMTHDRMTPNIKGEILLR